MAKKIAATFVLVSEGNIEKRRGKFYPRLAGYDSATGRRMRPGLGGFDTLKAAKAARHDAVTGLKRGTRLDRALTLEEYLMGWLERRSLQVQPNTFSNYSVNLRRYVIPRIGAVPLTAVDSKMLVRLYKDIGQHGGRGGKALATTPRKVHLVLHKALADAVPEHLPYNPAVRVAPTEPEAETMAWTEDELNAYMDGAHEDMLAMAFLVTAAMGLRRAELLGLEWRDIDLEAGTVEVGRITRTEFYEMFDEPDERGRRGHVVVRDKKGAKSKSGHRILPMPPVAITAVRRYRKLQLEAKMAVGTSWLRSDRVFTDEVGRPLQPSRATKAFNRVVAEKGLRPLTLHGLRHTFATLGLEAGIDPIYMKELLGHASTKMLDRYQHTRPERLREAIEKLTAGIEAPPPSSRQSGHHG